MFWKANFTKLLKYIQGEIENFSKIWEHIFYTVCSHFFYVFCAKLQDGTQKSQCNFVYIMNFTNFYPFLGIFTALRPSFYYFLKKFWGSEVCLERCDSYGSFGYSNKKKKNILREICKRTHFPSIGTLALLLFHISQSPPLPPIHKMWIFFHPSLNNIAIFFCLKFLVFSTFYNIYCIYIYVYEALYVPTWPQLRYSRVNKNTNLDLTIASPGVMYTIN